jgi:hypothetical protein
MKSKIIPIAGDASFRNFYRLILNKKSKIIIVAKKDKYKNLIAYTAVNKFLRINKILTPKLYKHNFLKGTIVIQDFGDNSFFKIIHKNKNKFIVYTKLVDLLIKIQNIKPKSKVKNVKSGFHQIYKYSNKFLFKESDLFFDWYLPFFIKKKKALKIKIKAKKILKKLYNRLNFSNNYFVHRDYHSQNLIEVGGKIGVIDGQDALIGNPAYDLASLIDDVRIETSKKLKNKIYDYYLMKNSKFKANSKEFLEDFNILSVQRSLKIIGIFSRLFRRDKKRQYLKFIPYTWKLLDMRMKSKIFLDLKKILEENIPKKLRKTVISK